ncbi:acyltransferase family-domain-containing protein [Apiosordaria backusii]|uniref:Acyltransferase family-domain-containing protein n=1 Tax=Apiosordaria backusii TaxID=314023 RepID=A0AA40K6S9_9PEZI|nr:acyltransferase family-domain-containing protein [Apiosordaria backusii]
MLSPPTAGLPRLLLPRQTLAKFLLAMLPSFLADRLFPDHRPASYRVHPTSYLDGLRGIASIIVFFCHYTENNFSALTPSHGLNVDRASSFIQLPYFRIIFSGRPMVHIFFVISGFALSYKPIKALHARDLDKCYTALASSTFRRAFRLFGPCVVSTFMILCLRQMGYLGPAQDTLMEEIWKWKGAVFHQITWGWAWDRDLMPAYDIHLWTIPIEFAHSMLLFMVVLMLSRVKLHIRMASVLGLMGYCLMCGKWAGFEFLAGLFLAEVFVLKQEGRKHKEWEAEREKEGLTGPVMLGADKTPGIRWFFEKTPLPFAEMDHLAPQKFWFGLSAVCMVWAVGELDCLRRFFEGGLAQYCGRISYAVYICHGPVMDMIQAYILGHLDIPARGQPGDANFKAALPASGVKGFFGVKTPAQITMSWFIGLWMIGPFVIWAADVFWRVVDNRIVDWGKRLENWCLDEDTGPSPRSQGYSVAA